MMEYKRLVTFHPSHHRKVGGKHTDKKEEGTGLLSIFVSLLAEPLSKSGASRTDADHLTIELVLHLIRNFLSAEPLLNSTYIQNETCMFLFVVASHPISTNSHIRPFVAFFCTASSTTSQQATQIHQEMISLFERELVMDILLVVGQEMELRENSQYNLLMMEILHHILKAQDPMAVAKSMAKASKKPMSAASSKSKQDRKPSFSSSSILSSKLKEEKSQQRNMVTVRHGHFGGTWMQKQSDGKRQFLSAASVVEKGGMESQSKHLVQAKRKNRMAEPFIGSGKTLLAHTRTPMADSGPATKRANESLHKFCERFMADCYGPFMKSIKNEFRRDSVRLEESDKVVFFKLVWFFAQWWRSSYSTRSRSAQDSKEVIGRLIITMDVFTFNLVTTAVETFFVHKKYTRLAQTVALYSEMMHLLHDMYTSKDKTENEMAMGLIDRIFYGRQESLDPVPKLMSKWTPGTYTREYLCDLVEVVHISLKLLEANTKKGIEFVQGKSASDEKKVSNRIAKMRATAADFDIKGYLVRKVVSNQMVTMYGHLLAHYKINSSVVNHRAIAMFLRMMRVEIASPDVADVETPMNPLGTKRATLEPMLYNLQLIMVMEQILNDATIRKEKDFESLLQFGTSLMYKFRSAADTNPMLYVESLFRHAAPHRYCDSVTNMYISDELRMIAEREMLMLEADSDAENEEPGIIRPRVVVNQKNDDDDDEEELEFTGDAVLGARAETEGQTASAEEESRNENTESADEDVASDPDHGGERNAVSQGISEKRPRDEEEHRADLSENKRVRATPAAGDSSDDDIDFGASSTEVDSSQKDDGKAAAPKQVTSILDDTDEED
ncbi:MAG: hypothetical protein SGILL_007808 [Bacillariaceae sp.]